LKTTTLALILFLTGLHLWAQNMPVTRQPTNRVHAITSNIGPAAVPAANVAPAPAVTPLTPAAGSPAPMAVPAPAPATAGADNTSNNAASEEEIIPAGNINFQGVDVSQVLEVYAKLVGRTLLRAGLPSAQIVLKT
jgi:hypothetical protein